MARYEFLIHRWHAGEISDIEIHPVYPILINGKTLKIYYEADFRYRDIKLNKVIVEDVKGAYYKKKVSKRKGKVVREWKERVPILTPEYKVKKAIIEALWEITVTEVWH